VIIPISRDNSTMPCFSPERNPAAALWMGFMQQVSVRSWCVQISLLKRQVYSFDRVQLGRHPDNEKREEDTHPEYSDHDADGQEHFLPERFIRSRMRALTTTLSKLRLILRMPRIKVQNQCLGTAVDDCHGQGSHCDREGPPESSKEHHGSNLMNRFPPIFNGYDGRALAPSIPLAGETVPCCIDIVRKAAAS
jgi:hypothetical protein